MQLRIQQFGRPLAAIGRGEPALLGVVHERLVGARFSQIEVRPEIVRVQAFEKFAQRAGACREFGGTLAIGKQHRAVVIAHMH